jgi:DNA mismatch repair protein MutS
VASAKRKLQQLETSQITQHSVQPDMFASTESSTEAAIHPVLIELETLQPDDLTPKQALEFLYKIKEILDKS